MKKKTNWWTIAIVLVLVFAVVIGAPMIAHQIKSTATKMGVIPYFTYTVTDDSVRIEDNVYRLQFESKRAKVGYNGQTFQVCSDNKISDLNVDGNKLIKSLAEKEVTCCTYEDCTMNQGTGMECMIDWKASDSYCVSASSLICNSDINCPGEGAWVPDWSVKLLKKYNCVQGFCTVKEETPFECWMGEGCPSNTKCVDYMCQKTGVMW